MFTPLPSFLGGVLLGVSVYTNALHFGLTTGTSNYLSQTVFHRSLPHFSFLFSLLLCGQLSHIFHPTPPSLTAIPLPRILISGLLVGFGTTLSNGCTSGHGLCGMARLSPRSFLATALFMCAAVASATISQTASFYDTPLPPPYSTQVLLAVVCVLGALPFLIAVLLKSLQLKHSSVSVILQNVYGLLFATGLIMSGMAQPAKTVAFLDFSSGKWDPSLLFVFVGGLPVSFFAFRSLIQGRKPIFTKKHSLSTLTKFDANLVIGALMFGVGWGLIGLCPAPALVYFGAFVTRWQSWAFMSAVVAGSFVARYAK